MSGGARYWNEETQRWEDGDGTGNTSAQATPPPPARPDFAPVWSPGEGAAGTDASSAGPPEQPGGGGEVLPSAPWPSGAAGTGVSWPPAVQLAAPVPARGMSRRLVWSVLAGAAAVGVAVSLVLTLVVGSGDDEDDPSAAASASPTAGASRQSDPYASPSPSPTEETASPSSSAPELPAGYEAYEDTEGFWIGRPEGWKRSSVDSQYGIAVVNYRSPDGRHRLQVYQVSEESPDASFELYLSDETSKPAGFEELSLQNLDDGEFTGSRLEYLADSLKGEPDVGTWHVYDERFVASDGNIYAIAAYGPDADGRDDELALLTTALEWFCPPFGECAPAAVD
ncbi:hypothetical protein [Streptomyces sp. 2A115]|uniref:hypothetical protein n=1 Tax=Streptomyces sp. 2A115 TaxID=3457439 RepID=UPI003FD34B06